MGFYSQYNRLKQTIKPYIPKWLLSHVVNIFHLLEAVVASAINGFPARSMKFVGITGTNGKTTTTLLTAEILREAGYTVGVNSTAVIGLAGELRYNEMQLTTANPFQVQRLLRDLKKAGCEWVVMEVASHALAQNRVWGIRFETTIFTNLTRDHLDYHGTMEEYAAAKGRLFRKFPRVSALNRDDEWYDYFAQFDAVQQISYGTSKEADCRITSAKLSSKRTKLKLKLDEYSLDVTLNLPGKFNAYNALAAATATYAMNISLDHIKSGLEKVKAIPGRMQLIEEGQDFNVIVDYAHTPVALDGTLKTVRETLKGRLIIVLGIGGDRDPGKRPALGRVAAENCEVVIVADLEPRTEDPAQIRQGLLKGANSVEHGVVVKEIPDRREAIYQALRYAKKGDAVFLPALGHQQVREMADGPMEWDEREVARSLLKDLLEEEKQKQAKKSPAKKKK